MAKKVSADTENSRRSGQTGDACRCVQSPLVVLQKVRKGGDFF